MEVLVKFTAAEKAAEAKREHAMRVRVYGRWVDAGRMTREAADRKIALMHEIAQEYAAQAEAEKARAAPMLPL